jgi:polysaccharide biosynthesis/export protein
MKLSWRGYVGCGAMTRLVGMAAVALLAGSGCAQHVYRVANLPAEYAALPAANLDTLNLSRLVDNVGASDVIAWGDLVSVEIDVGLPSLPPRVSKVRVAKDGTAGIPLVGRVRLAGMEVEQAEQAVAAACRDRDVFPNAYVSLRIEEPRKNRVTVVGAVAEPGVFELHRGESSLLGALVAAKGLSKEASGGVEIRRADPRLTAPGVLQAARPGPTGQEGTELVSHETSLSPDAGVIHVNLLTMLDAPGTHAIEDGDVVNVVKRNLPPVYVMGLVNKPGAVEMSTKREIRVLDALAVSGGCSNHMADKVVVVRRSPNEGPPISIGLSIQKAIEGPDNLLLAPGDTVVVRQTPETVISDLFKSFLRFGISGSVPLY